MQRASIGSTGTTSAIEAKAGSAVVSIDSGGSTYQLQIKLKRTTSNWKTIPFPNASGTFVTSTSDSVCIEGPGNVEYRLNVTSFVAEASIELGSY